jgi:DNA-binding GntR family transcriptional regulator
MTGKRGATRLDGGTAGGGGARAEVGPRAEPNAGPNAEPGAGSAVAPGRVVARPKPGTGAATGTRVDTIFRALSDAILAQELTPGMKLSEETIGAFFGVSRTVVRAVFNRLQTISLVELKPNRGAFIASPTVEEAQNVFRARICIEREIAAELARRIRDTDLDRLEAHLDSERKAHERGDTAAAIALSGEFHQLAADMAGNDVLARILSDLIARTSLVLALHGRHNASECGLHEHQAIIAALRGRDPQAAAAAMTSHLQDIVSRTRLSQDSRPVRDLAAILKRYA